MPEPKTNGSPVPGINIAPPTKVEARKHLLYLDSLVEQMRKQIHEERKAGAPALKELRESLKRSQAQVDRTAAEIDAAKEQARKRKDEIEDWQRWYESRPQDE